MKRKLLVAASVAAALVTAAGCSSSGSKSSASGGSGASAKGTVNVWLMVDAQKSWPKAVADANAMFNKTYPNVKVNVTYQQWTTYQSKFDAAAQSNSEPDAIEFGNSQTTYYMANGALTDLTGQKSSYPNSATWLSGLTQSCEYKGKLYCVPYYAATRAVAYRKDMFSKAGISGTPTSWSQLLGDVTKLKQSSYGKNANFSAFYLPGDYEYAGLSFVVDAGGQLATQNAAGQWQGGLESPQSEKGLANFKALIDAGYKGDRTTNELKQAATMAAGQTAMFYGTQYDASGVYGPAAAGGDPSLKSEVGVFGLPSPTNAGKEVPVFVGGSDLAVPSKAKNADWGEAWIKDYTSNQVENEFMTGNAIPNSTALAAASSNPLIKQFSSSLSNSWFTPLAVNWANLDQQKVFDTLLINVATGKQTIPQAAKAADKQINTVLNAKS